MQEYNVRIKISNDEIYTERVTEGTRFLSFVGKYQKYYNDEIVLVSANNKLRELGKVIDGDCELSFVTMTDRDGKRAYRRSITLLLQKAVYNLWGREAHVRVLHSLGESYYCELEGRVIDKASLLILKQEMMRLVDLDITIKKQNVKTDRAREVFHEYKLYDKERLMMFHLSYTR